MSLTIVRRNPLRRFYGVGDLHFITVSCYHRKPLLGTPRVRDTLLKILDLARERHRFSLVGYVVMPEHCHLLLSEPPEGNPSTVMHTFKQCSAFAIRGKAPTGSGPRPPFWQRRFYDFNVCSARKVNEKLEYMHANPVERELVAHPREWPWSSWSWYDHGEEGLIRIDDFR